MTVTSSPLMDFRTANFTTKWPWSRRAVYRPDWTSPDRLAYTNLLFDLLAELVPAEVEGSVSTLPGSFKEFITTPGQERVIRDNVWRCVEHVAALSARTWGENCTLGWSHGSRWALV